MFRLLLSGWRWRGSKAKLTLNKKTQIQKEIEAAKDLAVDFLPRLTNLLNPSILQSKEHFMAGIVSIATSFVGDRIKKLLEEFRSKGENIDEGIANSEKSEQVFLDLIKFVAQENPDMETWDAAKKIFLHTLEKDMDEQKRASLYELLSICKELSGTEIRILAGAYQIFKNHAEGVGNHQSVNQWASSVARHIGIETVEEILRYEDNLIKQKLISPRESLSGDVRNTWDPAGGTSWHRLTPLGRKLAESFLDK